MAIGYGVTVFAPLGPDFIPQEALIGLNAAIIGGFFAALLGGSPGQISGPQASLTMVLTAGTAVHAILSLLADNIQPVAVIGELSLTVPAIVVSGEILGHLAHQLTHTLHYSVFYDLCGYGIVLGMLGSMESLMSSSALENLDEIKVDSNRELIGQGFGNIAAALFGSISSAGSIIRSRANIRAGGRGRLSGALCSLVMLLCIWTIAPLIGKIPLAIFAGIVLSVGLTFFDLSVLRFVKFYRPLSGIQKDIFISFFVHVCVAVITVALSLNIWISKHSKKGTRSSAKAKTTATC